jgi:hypothetical protein
LQAVLCKLATASYLLAMAGLQVILDNLAMAKRQLAMAKYQALT